MREDWIRSQSLPQWHPQDGAVTLKDDKGGIVSLNVNEQFDMRQLKPAASGEAVSEKSSARFVIGMAHHDPSGTFAPATKPGNYDLFISVGQRDGSPQLALPLPGDDGQHRYKMGQIRVETGQK